MEISIIIPVYNSDQILPELVSQIKKEAESFSKKFEVILVNDFSQDDSWKIIKNLSYRYNFVKGINLKKNYGQHNAIAAGLNFSLGNYIVLMDDDLQHNPVYIKDIVYELKKGNDACYVKYLKRKHVFWKKFLSWLNNATSSFLANKPFNIYTSSFKGFNREICQNILNDKSNEVFLDWIILENSNKTKSINIYHQKRFSGNTNYNLEKLFILWSSMIIGIKPKTKTNKIILDIIKFFINNFLYKIIKKRDIKEKYSISEKTF